MKNSHYKGVAEKILSPAGIEINGDKPWDIKVNNEDFYPRVLSQGSLGLGESYMDGWWNCERLDEFFYRIICYRVPERVRHNLSVLTRAVMAKLFNLQSRKRAFNIGIRHYDLGNELFFNMLDCRAVYSCGYWKNANTLDEAQENKLDLICRKLGLQPGMRLLDIGCGWGSLAKYAAEKYKAEVVGITVSKQQAEFGKELCGELPVEIRLQDYRDLNQQFDRVVSVGMFEHVGCKNYQTFMEVVHRCLKTYGLFLLHTIGGNRSVAATDAWINKYIFPNGMLPSIKQIGSSIEGLFVMEDWHNLSTNYDKTLMAWYQNFVDKWHNLEHHYDHKYFRMWSYYLLSCAASFRARSNQLWQIVLSREGVPGGYNSIR